MRSDPDQNSSIYSQLPLMEVEVLESLDDLRRSHSRTFRDWPLRLVDDVGSCHEISLKVVRRDQDGDVHAHSVLLLEASANGLSMSSRLGMNRGDWLTVAGVRDEDAVLLFSEDYQVCNVRRQAQSANAGRDPAISESVFAFGMGQGFLDGIGGHPTFIYGLHCELEDRPGSWVFQSLLQSIYYNHLQRHCPDLGNVSPWWRES